MEKDIVTITIPKTEYDFLKAENAELTQKVEWLMAQFKLSRHRQFGSSSEKITYDQLNLFNEVESTADANTTELELVEIERHFRKRKRLINDRRPDDLPIEVVEHDLPS